MLIKPCENGVRFSALIQPQSSKNGVKGIDNNALKTRLTPTPAEDIANKAFIRFLAKWLDMSASKVNILKELSSKNKTIEVTGLEEKQFCEILKNRNLVP
jgi:uncharacterized protein YggU (UPF0235/DUF167 family)